MLKSAGEQNGSEIRVGKIDLRLFSIHFFGEEPERRVLKSRLSAFRQSQKSTFTVTVFALRY